MKSPVHVQLYGSKHKRKLLLESAKSAIYTIQNLRNLEGIRTEKKTKITRLKKLLLQIKDAIGILDLKDVPGFRPGMKQEEETKEKQKETYRERDSLAADLEEIERKLNSL